MQAKSTSRNLNNFDIIRVLGIGLVVLRHSFAPYTGSWDVSEFYTQNEIARILGEYVSTISMPLFVFISGYIYSYLRNYLNKYRGFKILLTKKTKRLLIPYLILGPIYIYFFLEASNIHDYLSYMISGPGHLWFLLMIFFLFLAFYFLENFFKKKLLWGAICVFLLYSLESITYYLGMHILAMVFKYFPFFFLGYMFYYHNAKINRILKGKGWIVFIMHLTLFILFIFYDQFIDNKIIRLIFNRYLVLTLGTLSISFIYICFRNADYVKSSIKGRIIHQINDNSYYIYLIHQPILELLFLNTFLQQLPIYLVIPFAFLTSFFGSYLISKPILRFKYGRMLIGAK